MLNLRVKVLERHLDYMGWLIEVLKDDEIEGDMKQVYFSISKPGAIRGNHFHKRKVEWFSVVKGTARLVARDNDSGEERDLALSDVDITTVRIPPNVQHAIRAEGTEDMYLIVIADEVFNPRDPDTYEAHLL